MLFVVLTAVAPIFVTIIAGFLIRRSGVLSAEADTSLMRICVNLLYPCLIVSSILGNPALHQRENVWLPPVIAALTVIASFGICWAGARLLRVERGRDTRTFTYVTGLYNYGYAAIPLVASLFGAKTMGVLFTHNLGVEIALWIGASLILSTHPDRSNWRRAINAPVLAIIGSVALNFLHADAHIPEWILQSVRMLGAAAIPMALLLTGAIMNDLLAEARPTGSESLALGGACVLRLGLLPLVFLSSARWLPCSVELKQVLIVQSAMSAAMFPVVLCKHYGGNAALAVQIVLATTVLSLLTMPYWIAFGLKFAGLEP